MFGFFGANISFGRKLIGTRPRVLRTHGLRGAVDAEREGSVLAARQMLADAGRSICYGKNPTSHQTMVFCSGKYYFRCFGRDVVGNLARFAVGFGEKSVRVRGQRVCFAKAIPAKVF
jgi:hypothetical protein